MVSIITVNYNNHSLTESLLNSILNKNTYRNIEMIVVDNGSEVNPISGWEQKYPLIKFIRSEKNLGFAGGNNLGIAAAKGEYLFLINNDTEITENLIERLVNTLEENPQAGIVSPKILYYNTKVIQYLGYTPLNYVTARNKCIGQFEEDKGQYDSVVGPTGYAHGAAMMVKRKAIEKAGYMAENFFLYYEELDWCERIKKQGFQIWVDARAAIYHKESMSVGKHSLLKEYYMNRNRMLIVRKHASAVKRAGFLFYFLLVVTPISIIRYLKSKHSRFIPILGKAIWWNFTNRTDSKNMYFPVGK